jgi:hypothetical protein
VRLKIATKKTFNTTSLDTAFLLGRGKERAIVGTGTSGDAPIIKLLKIDIEGHNVDAAKGAEKYTTYSPPHDTSIIHLSRWVHLTIF